MICDGIDIDKNEYFADNNAMKNKQAIGIKSYPGMFILIRFTTNAIPDKNSQT